MIDRKNLILILFSVIIVSLPALTGKIHGGDDIIFHVARIKSISEGDFWIYKTWLFDFGSPVGIFYPSLFFFLPAFIFKLGASINFVVNSFMILIIVASAASSFIAFKILFENEKLATIGSICYISQWYFQNTLYFRADLGESVAMIFLPLAIASSNCLFRNYFHGRSSWVFAVISYTGLIESHIPTSLIFIGILFAIWIFEMIRQKSIDVLDVENLAKVVLATLGLNAFFLAPLIYFLTSMEDIAAAQIPTLIELNAFSLDQELDNIRHAYFFAIPLFIFTAYKIFRNELEYKLKWIFVIGLLSLLICVLIESNLTIWEIIDEFQPIAKIVEYPWRIMSIASIYLTASMAIAIYQFQKHFSIICIILVTYSISFSGHLEFNQPQAYFGWFESKTVEFSHDVTSATFSDGRKIDRIDSIDDRFSYSNARLDDLKLWQEYWLQRADKNELPVLFFEGYRVYDEAGNAVDIDHSDRHLIRLAYAEEQGKKFIYVYEGFIEFKFAIIVSILTFGFLMFVWSRSLSRH